MNEREIFMAALDIDDPADRAAYLTEACGDDVRLRERVDALLGSHDETGSFLQGNAAGVSSTLDQPIAEGPGTQIGPYKLLQEIGHGGMGVVYMAEQKEPVKRRVALKIIKPGMDTQQVIARFEAERQALAIMDHPNIAKVLDAGATASGRPYFVMELVHGVPITEYCDEKHLTPTQRLQLFLPVCEAVQHAHQKGIIHRDLKPSNVLVTRYDERPVPKVIDFGIAKATGQSLTEKTMFTQFGQVVGTLEYMSPEQAQPNQLDIDTRSDVYSLGVLLYELLTGTTPHERKRLRSAAFDEMLRIINEEEPPRPSARLSSIETLPSVAASRRTEPRKLRKLIRGDLDCIVMKALEKERGRRYETTSGLAADIQRFLTDEPVAASPPSPAYRFRKFARRHAGMLITTGIVAASLVLGTVVSVWQAVRAEQQRRVAESERTRAEAARDEANATVDEYFTTIANNDLLNAPGMQELRRELLGKAKEHYERHADQDADDPKLQAGKAMAYQNLGKIAEEGDAFDEAIDYFRRAANIQMDDSKLIKEYGNSLNGLGIAYDRQRRFVEALDAYRKASIQRKKLVATARRKILEDSALTSNDQKLQVMDFELSMANTYMNIGLTLREMKPAELADLPDELRDFLEEDASQELRTPPDFFQDANERRDRQKEILQSLLEQDPENSELRSRFTKVCRDLGKNYFSQALFTSKDLSLSNETVRHYSDAIASFEEALENFPNDIEIQWVVALCHYNRGKSVLRTDPVAARAHFKKARVALERLAYLNPTVPRYRRTLIALGLMFRNLGLTQYQANRSDLESALENLKSMEDLFTQLENQFPNQNRHRLNEAKDLIKQFQSYSKLRESEEPHEGTDNTESAAPAP